MALQETDIISFGIQLKFCKLGDELYYISFL